MRLQNMVLSHLFPNFISDHAVETLNREFVHTCGTETCRFKFISHDDSFVEPSHEHDNILEDLLTPHVQIVGYSASLFCLSEDASNTQSFLIWNPSIRKLVELPFFSSEKERVLGFGFDSNSGVCKVLRVVYCRRRDLVPVVSEIFDMRTGVWRSLSPTLHWMANEYSSHCSILSLDLSSEVIRVIGTPDGLEFKDYYDKTKVWSINRLLSVALSSRLQDVGDRHCSIRSMEEYGVTVSWTKSYVIKLPDSLSLSTPFGFWEKSEVLLLACSRRNADFEDLVFTTWRAKNLLTLVSTNGFVYNLWLFKESLVLL